MRSRERGRLLLEVQSLVAPTDLAMPRRVGTGVDPKRLAMIVAVLSRHAGLSLGGADVFVNVAGGVRIEEPGADLPSRSRSRRPHAACRCRRARGVRGDRSHGPPPSRVAGRAASRRMPEAGDRDRRRAGGHARRAQHPRVVPVETSSCRRPGRAGHRPRTSGGDRGGDRRPWRRPEAELWRAVSPRETTRCGSVKTRDKPAIIRRRSRHGKSSAGLFL